MEKQEVKNIAKALLKFQSSVDKIKKDAKNPFFKSNYSTLSNILEHVTPILVECGLVLTQLPAENNTLISILIHAESGETISSVYQMCPIPEYTREKNKEGTEVVYRSSEYYTPQGIGSAISYARRYAICSILQLNVADDDGNEASGKKPVAEAKAVIPVGHTVKPSVKQNNQEFAKELSEMKPEAHTPVLVVEESEEEKAAKFLAKKSYKDNSKKQVAKEPIDVDAEKISMYALEAAAFIKKLKTKQGVKEAVKPRADLLRTKEGITEKDMEYFKIECTNYYNSLTN